MAQLDTTGRLLLLLLYEQNSLKFRSLFTIKSNNGIFAIYVQFRRKKLRLRQSCLLYYILNTTN